MRTVFILSIFFGGASFANAGELDRPKLSTQEAWTYHNTVEKGGTSRERRDEVAVVRVNGDSVLVRTREIGSPLPAKEQIFGSDWSRLRSVNGEEKVVNRPLSFPLSVGKTWRVEYTEENPTPQHRSEHFVSPSRVTGWEAVTVPAGDFRALKIEVNGTWSAELVPRVVTNAIIVKGGEKSALLAQKNAIPAKKASGRIYKAFWYVPSIKRWVKSIEEYYSSDGVRTERYSSELENYTSGAPPSSENSERL